MKQREGLAECNCDIVGPVMLVRYGVNYNRNNRGLKCFAGSMKIYERFYKIESTVKASKFL